MAIPQATGILHHLRQTVLRHDGAGPTDGQLLRSFLYRGDESAFEALVRRHGPMVRGVCRRVLRNREDADDAFQAAFLVLLRKASTLTMREVLGDWLHGVAYRTALKARTAAARRRMKEKQALRHEAILDDRDRSEWLALLDEEIGRLPLKYRQPVVLCDLEGRTRKDAARQLGWPEGSVSGRLSRARAILARRLMRRGVTLSAVVLATGMAGEASARLPFALVGSIYKAARNFAAGSAARSLSSPVIALTEGVVKAMFLAKLKKTVALATLVLVLTAGLGAWRFVAVAGQIEEKPIPDTRDVGPVPMPKMEEAKHLVIPPGRRRYQIDLRIEREKDGQREVPHTPQLFSLDQQAVTFMCGRGNLFDLDHPVAVGGGIEDRIHLGLSVRCVVRADGGDKVYLDMTVSQTTRAAFALHDTTVEMKSIRVIRQLTLGEPTTAMLETDGKESAVWVVTAAIQLMEKETEPNTITNAEKNFQMAEFWRRTGRPDSARFFYELICRNYPDTTTAERAKARLAELKKKEKPPVRVGQIFIIGNKRYSDEAILGRVNLFPGQTLSYPVLRGAEQNLAQLKGLKSNPQVTVIDREGELKDIQITVEEK